MDVKRRRDQKEKETAFACLMVEICNGIFALSLCILNRGQTGLGNSGRENDTHNLIPKERNSRGTNKQANKILHHYNSEIVAKANRDKKKKNQVWRSKGLM